MISQRYPRNFNGYTYVVSIPMRWENCRPMTITLKSLTFKPIYLLSGSQSEPSGESYLFCPSMYSTRRTTTGTMLLICLPRRVVISWLQLSTREGRESSPTSMVTTQWFNLLSDQMFFVWFQESEGPFHTSYCISLQQAESLRSDHRRWRWLTSLPRWQLL